MPRFFLNTALFRNAFNKKDFRRDNFYGRETFIVLLAIVALFVGLTIWTSLTTRPESDEGSFASPALNLAQNGHFGTTVLETEKSKLTRINERTYWVMPLFLLNAAAAFKTFGFSLLAMRSVSIFWGAILLIAWHYIVFKFSGKTTYAAVCTALMGCHYVILSNASIARGDTMCAALGFAAIAVYLRLREQNLLLAIFLSQTFVVLSGLTHFLGILPFLALLFLTFYYDFRSLRLKHIGAALVPYLIGGAAFGFWILQDLEAFRDQFINNALASGRMEGFSSPFDVITREFTLRYARAFGLLESTAGYSGPIFLKSLMLVGYAIGVLGVLLNRELRKNYRVLLILTAIYFITMAVLDGQKLAVYLIYIVPFYLALLGIWATAMWEKGRIPKPLILLALIGFSLLGVGGIALRNRQNIYANFFLPTAEYLNKNAAPGELIMSAPEMRFALKSFDNHISDGTFGYYTGKRPVYIVFDPGVDDSWKDSKIYFPEFYEYFPRLLKDEYHVVYENPVYKIYKRN